ncbi:MAG: lipocalin family protein [Woeseiaceae bacterium]
MLSFRVLRRVCSGRGALLAALSTMFTGCLGIPDNVTVAEDFQLERYLGTWYEIARLDHRFERGLSRVEAQYSLRDDNGIRVINRGFDAKKGTWSEAEGKAYFVGDSDIGRLKVSFFGPFYGAYNIVELDHENYDYAMVSGPNTRYLWILARDPQLEPAIRDNLVAKAKTLGFPVEELIFPEHVNATN